MYEKFINLGKTIEVDLTEKYVTRSLKKAEMAKEQEE